MKSIICITLIIIALSSSCSDRDDVVRSGSIYGKIIDKGTGDPIMAAHITLFDENNAIVNRPQPTSDQGYYEFMGLREGDYTLQIDKTDYNRIVDHPVTLRLGEKKRRDFGLEKPPVFLQIIDGKGERIDTLDFGKDKDLGLFQILNFGSTSLDWSIGKNDSWITMISPPKGELAINAPQPITVEIDRRNLDAGQNTGNLAVVSNNGNKVLKITAYGQYIEPKIIVLPLSNLYFPDSPPAFLDTFNGEITYAGKPSYYKRGFCYSSLREKPTIEDDYIEETASGLGKYAICVKKHKLPWQSLSYVNPHSTTFYIRAWVAYKDEMNDEQIMYSDNVATVSIPGYLD